MARGDTVRQGDTVKQGDAVQQLPKARGRGASHNPHNRFESLGITLDPAEWEADDEAPGRHTIFYRDVSKTVLARNDSPDIGYDVSLNLPGLRARLYLLLRPADARILGVFAGP